MKDAVAAAIEEIKAAHPGAAVTIREDGDGGAMLVVDPVALSDTFAQTDTWIGFHVSFQFPFADVYPLFVRGDLTRRDGQPLGEAMSPSSFEGRPAVQISRRSNRLNPAVDTAALKVAKVMQWLRQR